MGNFYVNFGVRSSDLSKTVAALRQAGRVAYIAPPANNILVVYDRDSDTQDESEIVKVGGLLSESVSSAVLAVLNHDDDVLCYWLFEQGRIIDSYNSAPGYFEGDDVLPTSSDVERLCEAFDSPGVFDEVQANLQWSEYAFVVEQHQELVELLGLPDASVGSGYTTISQNEPPLGMELSDLQRIG